MTIRPGAGLFAMVVVPPHKEVSDSSSRTNKPAHTSDVL